MYTAAQANQIRDNLLETGPALVPATGYILVSDGTNSLAPRGISQGNVSTSEGTYTLTYTDIATAGPAVTVTTGTRAIVAVTANTATTSNDGGTLMGYDISGATTLAASDDRAVGIYNKVASQATNASKIILQSGLTAGSNVFTCKYRAVTAGWATWSYRMILVIGL